METIYLTSMGDVITRLRLFYTAAKGAVENAFTDQ
jgi:hypothetical protein